MMEGKTSPLNIFIAMNITLLLYAQGKQVAAGARVTTPVLLATITDHRLPLA
jgi:hypothetical protein